MCVACEARSEARGRPVGVICVPARGEFQQKTECRRNISGASAVTVEQTAAPAEGAQGHALLLEQGPPSRDPLRKGSSRGETSCESQTPIKDANS